MYLLSFTCQTDVTNSEKIFPFLLPSSGKTCTSHHTKQKNKTWNFYSVPSGIYLDLLWKIWHPPKTMACNCHNQFVEITMGVTASKPKIKNCFTITLSSEVTQTHQPVQILKELRARFPPKAKAAYSVKTWLCLPFDICTSITHGTFLHALSHSGLLWRSRDGGRRVRLGEKLVCQQLDLSQQVVVNDWRGLLWLAGHHLCVHHKLLLQKLQLLKLHFLPRGH